MTSPTKLLLPKKNGYEFQEIIIIMIMSSAPLSCEFNWLPVKELLYLRGSVMAEECLNNLVPT